MYITRKTYIFKKDKPTTLSLYDFSFPKAHKDNRFNNSNTIKKLEIVCMESNSYSTIEMDFKIKYFKIQTLEMLFLQDLIVKNIKIYLYLLRFNYEQTL